MRNVELSLASGDDLDVRTFNVFETMSAAFQIDLVARSHDDALDLHAIGGRPAELRLHGDHGGRRWSGVCAQIAQTGVAPEGLATYTLKIVPTLWLLTQRTNHRLFKHLTVPEIVEKILGEWHIAVKARLAHRYPRLPARTQYGETDYDFVRRLLAEAGISFYFEPEAGKSEERVVLADAPQTAEPLAGGPIPFVADASLARGAPYVSDVEIATKVVPTRATFRDHDFRRPRFPVTGTHGAEGAELLLEDYRYVPGHSLAEAEGGGAQPLADRHGVYRHDEQHATERARRHLEAALADETQVAFATSRLDLAPGAVFAIAEHPHPQVQSDKKLLVTDAWINGDVGADGWHAGGRAVPADRAYRPAVDRTPGASAGAACNPFEPVRHVDPPRVHGVESATVTGPEGEEIHTDEHGRVALRYPWDREATAHDATAPWVRVSQAWAGAGHGVHAVPRVGHEVMVAYEHGNPDHPVVVGRVHNATAPTPYALPEHKTRTSLRTSSSAGANEITFDDAPGQELFYMQAERDLHKLVKNDELELTHGSRHIHVDGDLTLSAGGRIIVQAGKDLVVKGGPHVKINPTAAPKPAPKPAPLGAKKPAPAANPNARLMDMNPGSMPNSIIQARDYKAYAEKYKKDAEILGKKFGLPPALILALMSRESGFGTTLVDGWGDYHHGFGILQVDNRSHTPVGGPYSLEHMEQAMGIFDGGLAEVKAKHPGWTSDQQLAGAVAAYNAGSANIATQPTNPSSWAQMDVGTTGDNYSRDVWAQAQWYSQNLEW